MFKRQRSHLSLPIGVIIMVLLINSARGTEIIKHIGLDTSSVDQQKFYFPSILQLVIEKSIAKYGKAERQLVPLPMGEERQFVSLDKGILDVVWTMTSIKREQQALAIRIPLLKGLLGYRVLVIRKNQQPYIDALTDITPLKMLTAVQGYAWPDVEILKQNGFKVVESSWYDSIYKSLNAGFYDYFPRSILEAYSELEHFKYENLTVDERHLLIYPTAIYFFVNKNNLLLAERLEFGLEQAIADGSFEQHFRQYPQHIEALKKLTSQHHLIHQLNNPILPADTPLEDSSLWFQFNNNTLAKK